MNTEHLPSRKKQIPLFIAGICLTGCGVALITKAGLGTSAITSFSYVLSLIFPLSLGMFAFIVNVFMVITQMILLRLRRQLTSGTAWIRLLLQIPAAVLFAASIDMLVYALRFISLHAYWQQIILLLFGCVVFGAGIAMEVTANVIILPAEAFIKAISDAVKLNFGTVKTLVDLLMCGAAVLLSFLYSGKICGVREGTLITALTVGGISRFFLRLFGRSAEEKGERK